MSLSKLLVVIRVNACGLVSTLVYYIWLIGVHLYLHRAKNFVSLHQNFSIINLRPGMRKPELSTQNKPIHILQYVSPLLLKILEICELHEIPS